MEETLLTRIRFDQCDQLFGSPGESQVTQAFLVDREDSARRTVLRRHVGDGGAVGQRQILQSWTEVLDEFPHHPMFAQHLGDGEHQIGRGCTLAQPSSQFHSHDQWYEHRDRLTQHGGFSLDPTDAPAQHAKSIDHGGVRVCSHQRVGIRYSLSIRLLHEHNTRQIFKVHLVNDARVGRNNRQIVEGRLPPAQERVSLLVPQELQLRIQPKGVCRAELIHLHRMVDHQFCRLQWVDQLRIAA